MSIVGNVFLATCCVAYYGPYTGQFRDKFLTKISAKLEELQIQFQSNFSLQDVLGDNLEIADWINYGLPKDNVSINSALLVSKSLQNPMMVDPQLQASKWLKNMMRQFDLVSLKTGGDNFLKNLEKNSQKIQENSKKYAIFGALWSMLCSTRRKKFHIFLNFPEFSVIF